MKKRARSISTSSEEEAEAEMENQAKKKKQEQKKIKDSKPSTSKAADEDFSDGEDDNKTQTSDQTGEKKVSSFFIPREFLGFTYRVIDKNWHSLTNLPF